MISLLTSGNVRATNPEYGAQREAFVVDGNDDGQQHGGTCLDDRHKVVDGKFVASVVIRALAPKRCDTRLSRLARQTERLVVQVRLLLRPITLQDHVLANPIIKDIACTVGRSPYLAVAQRCIAG